MAVLARPLCAVRAGHATKLQVRRASNASPAGQRPQRQQRPPGAQGAQGAQGTFRRPGQRGQSRPNARPAAGASASGDAEPRRRPVRNSSSRQSVEDRIAASNLVIKGNTRRTQMYRWLKYGLGKFFRYPNSARLPHYLGSYLPNGNRRTQSGPSPLDAGSPQFQDDRPLDVSPFPANPLFKSEPVVGEAMRDELHRRVASGNTMRRVAADMSVSMERVSAVYRMKEIENRWLKEGKSLQTYYQRTVLGMLPRAEPIEQGKFPRFEDIMDIPVHAKTRRQMFYPTSESARFTRKDAAHAFDPRLKPADERVAHPELIETFRDRLQGFDGALLKERVNERYAALARHDMNATDRARRAEARHTQTVPGARWDFHIRDANVNDAGADGRNRRGVGWRYGNPLPDRQHIVKIPTRVD